MAAAAVMEVAVTEVVDSTAAVEVSTVGAFTAVAAMSAASMEAAAMSADFMAEDFTAAALVPFTARRGRRTARVTSKPHQRMSAPRKSTRPKSTLAQITTRDFHKAQPPAGTRPQAAPFSATPTP
jgi:hypothetical protein